MTLYVRNYIMTCNFWLKNCSFHVLLVWKIKRKGNGSEGLRVIEDFCPSSQPGTLRKKIICTKKAYEIDHAEICLWIYSIFFSHQL